MIPTLNGRIQTRLFAVLVIGGLWTLLISTFLPGVGDGAPAGEVYKMTFSVLVTVAVVGVVWECIYHVLMQLRWEKDWPTLFGLLTGINEAVVLWALIRADLIPNVSEFLPNRTWLTHFITTWIIIWLWLNGPMKVVFHRWRVRGGRIFGV